jgi:hypothetical protein
MGTEIDWQRELDGSFGDGRDVHPGHYVAAGRRAVRRRRATAVVLAAVVVAGGAGWATTLDTGSATRGDAPIATSGPAPTDDQDGRAERKDRLRELRAARDAKADEPMFLGEPATLDVDGLVLAPGAGPVLERVDNPMGYTDVQGRSLGIRVMYKGREKYSLLVRHSDGGTSMGTNDATGDFAAWLEGRVASQHSLDVSNGVTGPMGTIAPDDWIRVAADGAVLPGDDAVVVLAGRDDLDLGDFAPGADHAGIARLRVGDRPQVVIYRVVDGVLEVIPLGDWAGTFEVLAKVVRQQYASGEGMR